MNLKEFLEETKNLQEINQDLIRKNPECIKYVRILLGMFQREFATLCNKHGKRISEYELGIHKPQHNSVRRILDSKIIDDLRKIKNPEETYEKNLKVLTELRLSGFGKSSNKEWVKRGYKSGYKGAEIAPATEQEKSIADKLMNMNKKFEMHKTVTDAKNKFTPINVDLFVKPNLYILLRKVSTKEKNNLVRHATQLALDGLRLKKRQSKLKIYCVFDAPKIPQKAEILLNECLDWWTTSSEKLINKIR